MSGAPETTELIPLLPMERLEQAARAMRVLAHPHRLRICELLLRGPVSVGQLAAELELAANAVSQHLSLLRAHGMLDCRREGKTVYYRVVAPQPKWLLGCVRDHQP